MNSRKILYFSIPEDFNRQFENFIVDPNIPIPVEIPGNDEVFNPEKLSWEMIIAGMLRVISEDEKEPEWIDYYRNFVFAVKPNILTEFSEIAILKAKNDGFDLAMEIYNILLGLFPFPSDAEAEIIENLKNAILIIIKLI